MGHKRYKRWVNTIIKSTVQIKEGCIIETLLYLKRGGINLYKAFPHKFMLFHFNIKGYSYSPLLFVRLTSQHTPRLQHGNMPLTGLSHQISHVELYLLYLQDNREVEEL